MPCYGRGKDVWKGVRVLHYWGDPSPRTGDETTTTTTLPDTTYVVEHNVALTYFNLILTYPNLT